MAGPAFIGEFEPRYGQCVDVAPGIRRVVADNPSKFTAWGTGTYIVGRGEVMIVDPGPARDEHIDAVLAAVSGETVTHLLVTHTHGDHSPATAAIQSVTGAATVGYGPHPRTETSADDEGLYELVDDSDEVDDSRDGERAGSGAAGTGDPPTEEHADTAFAPDIVVGHGDVIEGTELWIECLYTPGHISNHICYAERSTGALFPGDHVMGWSTTIIPPPDGNLADYLASLRLLVGRDDDAYYPTHGSPIPDPQPFVGQLLEHRLGRERQVIEQLAEGPRTIGEIVAVLYTDVRRELHKPAARSVHAHLVALMASGQVERVEAARFALTGRIGRRASRRADPASNVGLSAGLAGEPNRSEADRAPTRARYSVPGNQLGGPDV